MTIRIATRGSQLALAQANMIAERVRSELGREAELLTIKTSGDKLQSMPLSKVGGKGLFVKEIEEALLEERADLAVHSAKDLPAQIAPGCVLAAFPERVDPRDALVSRNGEPLADLPEGARVGTGSLRRTALLRVARPDLEVVPMRGNVTTRLRKLEEDSLAAVVLACAGLERLGLAERISERIATDTMLPAVAQGILALETREGDPLAQDLAKLESLEARTAAQAERAFLERLGGDCNVPLAALAEQEEDRLKLRALLASPDGQRVVRASGEDAGEDPAGLGRRIADEILKQGGDEILSALRSEASQ